jgi:hypothetical protein
MSAPTAQDFLLVRKDIRNKAGRLIGSIGTEDRHFREFFRAGPFVVADMWTLMVIPPDGEIKHLLWTLHFLKAYPKQATVCSMVGGSTGVIDPKTFRKYMWPFIYAVSDLEPVVVSMKYFFFIYFLNSTHRIFSRLISKAGKIVAVGMTASLVWMALTCASRSRDQSSQETSFFSHKFKGKYGLWYKIGVDILAGNIVWVNGPFTAGKYTNIKKICLGLVHWLEKFKRVEGDNGYIGEAPQ